MSCRKELCTYTCSPKVNTIYFTSFIFCSISTYHTVFQNSSDNTEHFKIWHKWESALRLSLDMTNTQREQESSFLSLKTGKQFLSSVGHVLLAVPPWGAEEQPNAGMAAPALGGKGSSGENSAFCQEQRCCCSMTRIWAPALAFTSGARAAFSTEWNMLPLLYCCCSGHTYNFF